MHPPTPPHPHTQTTITTTLPCPQSLKFFSAMERLKGACILDLEVVVEERCERYAAMLYPANAARNRALVNARTGGLGEGVCVCGGGDAWVCVAGMHWL